MAMLGDAAFAAAVVAAVACAVIHGAAVPGPPTTAGSDRWPWNAAGCGKLPTDETWRSDTNGPMPEAELPRRGVGLDHASSGN